MQYTVHMKQFAYHFSIAKLHSVVQHWQGCKHSAVVGTAVRSKTRQSGAAGASHVHIKDDWSTLLCSSHKCGIGACSLLPACPALVPKHAAVPPMHKEFGLQIDIRGLHWNLSQAGAQPYPGSEIEDYILDASSGPQTLSIAGEH